MKPQPLGVTLLENAAKADARGRQPGWVEHDGISCHYYPRSNSFGWWLFSRKCPKSTVLEHLRFQENFRKQA